jgi:hypothetical protein
MIDRRGLQKKRPKMENGNNDMKQRKPDVDRKEDTKVMPRKQQMAISRLRTGYKKAIHGPKMEGVASFF